jgi:glycosyltransferase involved in cell wall biosynthesis
MLIDVTRLADRTLQGRMPTGVDRVSLAYLHHYGSRARALVRFAGRWLELDAVGSKRLFRALLDDGAGRAATIRRCVGKGYALAWRRHRGAILLNTGHSGLDQVDYVREVERRGLRPLFFLHDLIPISHPEYCRPGEADKHHRRLDTMLSVGRGLIVNSAETRDELYAYAAARAVPVPPCVVAPLAPSRLPPSDSVRPIGAPYFVALGTIEPRKNHLLLLHLWRELAKALGESAPRLVVVGQRGWECEQVVDLLERCECLKGVVVERPRCDDGELATWLYHSRALLFPSFIEGFGIPLVEALTLGVPVIATDLAVFREIAGVIPDYLDPLDGLGWKRSILDYLSPAGSLRQAQIARMQGFVAPSWDAHFTVVDDLLARVRACS